MIAYHGTVMQGLTNLNPFAGPHANLKYPCVYLSTNKALAAIYVWKNAYKWMTFEMAESGIPVYNESFSGAWFEFYGDVMGCIYTCEADFEMSEGTRIKHAVISRTPVAVKEVDFIENAYERILSCEKDGLMVINRYENLTNEQKDKNKNMVMGAIKGLDLLKGEHVLSGFVAEKFPGIWQEALNFGDKWFQVLHTGSAWRC